MDSKILKDIACDIVEQEKQENNINFEFYPVNIVNYYKSYVWKKKINLLDKLSLLPMPFYSKGFAISDNKLKDIVVFFLARILILVILYLLVIMKLDIYNRGS